MYGKELDLFVIIGMQFAFFGFGLCILQTLTIYFSPQRRSAAAIFFYLCNSIYLLDFGLYLAGVPQRYPHAAFLLLTCLFMIGPANLFYYHDLLYDKIALPFNVWYHLIPAFACFLFELFFLFQPTEIQLAYLSIFSDKNPTSNPALIVLAASTIHMSIYYIYVMKIIISDINGSRSKNEFRFILYLSMAIFLNVLVFMFGFISGRVHIFAAGCMMNAMIHVSIYIAVRVHPKFFSNLRGEIRTKRYQRTMLKGLDTDIVSNRLMEIMGDKEVFMDSEITLQILANKLSLTTHQLSQLLNERMNTSFWDFINRFRIEEARKMMTQNPEASIISTCYRVGFNNKSSFNAAFKKWAGMTPTEFRNNIEKLKPAGTVAE